MRNPFLKNFKLKILLLSIKYQFDNIKRKQLVYREKLIFEIEACGKYNVYS